jgi:hypothetical protein
MILNRVDPTTPIIQFFRTITERSSFLVLKEQVLF